MTENNKLSQATIDLLRKVAKHILKEPRRLDMAHFGNTHKPYIIEKYPDLPPCGTSGCIAGWAVVLSDPNVQVVNGFYQLPPDYFEIDGTLEFEDFARLKLGLDKNQAENLFFFPHWIEGRETGNGWPLQFSMAYDGAESPAERASITVARIEHFIATDGRE